MIIWNRNEFAKNGLWRLAISGLVFQFRSWTNRQHIGKWRGSSISTCLQAIACNKWKQSTSIFGKRRAAAWDIQCPILRELQVKFISRFLKNTILDFFHIMTTRSFFMMVMYCVEIHTYCGGFWSLVCSCAYCAYSRFMILPAIFLNPRGSSSFLKLLKPLNYY